MLLQYVRRLNCRVEVEVEVELRGLPTGRLVQGRRAPPNTFERGISRGRKRIIAAATPVFDGRYTAQFTRLESIGAACQRASDPRLASRGDPSSSASTAPQPPSVSQPAPVPRILLLRLRSLAVVSLTVSLSRRTVADRSSSDTECNYIVRPRPAKTKTKTIGRFRSDSPDEVTCPQLRCARTLRHSDTLCCIY